MVQLNPEDTISEEGINKFQRDGFLFIPGVFSDDKIQQFRNEADRILELIINSSIANDRTSKRLGITEDSDNNQSIREIHPYIDLSRLFKNMAMNEISSILSPLIDGDPVSVDRTAQLNYKQPLSEQLSGLEVEEGGDQFPIHADWPYYEDRLPESLLTSIVFIDECNKDNGPIKVWPGTHRQDIEHTQTKNGLGVLSDRVSSDSCETMLGPAGSLLLLHPRIVHSSGPNTTESSRRLAVFRHVDSDDLEIDIRDGGARPGKITDYPIELIESTYENEYRRLKRENKFSDHFTAPNN